MAKSKEKAPKELVIVIRNIDELHDADYNPRKLSDEEANDIRASLIEFGMVDPAIINKHPDRLDVIVGGHQRRKIWKQMGNKTIPTTEVILELEKEKELNVRLNKNTGSFDMDLLTENFEKEDLLEWGFEGGDFPVVKEIPMEEESFEIPSNVKTKIVLGDIVEIGEHRIMCGDSTDSDQVATLMNGELANLIHADPPYGMGKEKDGVLNDNIYGEKLDQFQMDWWNSFFPFLLKNGSAYIWGNAPDLFRLWYTGGLCEYGELRNEIVWDKKNIPGMASPLMTQYPEASERCLFIQMGNLHQGSVNTDDYFEEWDGVRLYLAGEAKKAKIKSKDIKSLVEVDMYSHWFTKSQWTMIPEKHYLTLRETYDGHFTKSYTDLKKTHAIAQKNYRAMVDKDRPYFDNAHDSMTDVWDFGRVIGDERHGHATPKPVEMMRRALKSSCPEGGITVEPFLGSGSTMVAAHQLGIKCYGAELDPKYVQIICMRMMELDPSLTVIVNGKDKTEQFIKKED